MRALTPCDGARTVESTRRWAAICGLAGFAFAIGLFAGGCNPTGGRAGGGGASNQADQSDNGDQADPEDDDQSNGNQGETTEGDDEQERLDVEFDTDPEGGLFARVRSGDRIEFAIFAQKEDDGTVPAGRPANAVNTRFEDGSLVKTVLDPQGRPLNFDTPDFSAGIVYRTGSNGRNRMLMVYADGRDAVVDLDVDETVTGLEESETTLSDARLCGHVDRYVAMLQ